MPDSELTMRVNGREVRRAVPGHRLLRDFIRDDLGLTGTKVGCQDGMCGACSVIVDDLAVKSCLMLAAETAGSDVITIEGLGAAGKLSPEQQAIIDEFGFQCGFCTPGFIMTIAALLRSGCVFTPESARDALVGNICRCTGYESIVGAFLAAQRLRDGEVDGVGDAGEPGWAAHGSRDEGRRSDG